MSIDLGDVAARYERDGFAVIENFLTSTEVEELRKESSRLIEEEAANETSKQVFAHEHHGKSQYFIESSDKIRFFYEKEAYDFEKHDVKLPFSRSIAKIGHALHKLNPVFNKVTVAPKVKQILQCLNFVEPTVVQSMVIFKNPKVGGQYTPHQDASFLCTSDPNSLIGLWFALDPATEENGCLQFIAGSHREPLHRRWVRTEKALEDGRLLDWTGPAKEYNDEQFRLVPVKPGALVLIHGLVIHRSAHNYSDKSRWIYTFHAFDKGKSEYLKDNWLQDGANQTFMPIYSSEKNPL